jgi:hypothetical protein
MIRRLVCAAVTIACVAAAAPATAQSLADVARQEEARRKNPAAKRAVKSFSNADLAPSEIAPPAPAAPASEGCLTSVKEGKCIPAEEVIANSNAEPSQADVQVKTSEATIRQRADGIRQRLAKVQKEFDTVYATANDESRSPGERAAAARMASQRDGMLSSIEQQWQALEKQVADEELPREWLGVTPMFSTRTPQ